MDFFPENAKSGNEKVKFLWKVGKKCEFLGAGKLSSNCGEIWVLTSFADQAVEVPVGSKFLDLGYIFKKFSRFWIFWILDDFMRCTCFALEEKGFGRRVWDCWEGIWDFLSVLRLDWSWKNVNVIGGLSFRLRRYWVLSGGCRTAEVWRKKVEKWNWLKVSKVSVENLEVAGKTTYFGPF